MGIRHQTSLIHANDRIIDQLSKSFACQISHTSIVLPQEVKCITDVFVPMSLMGNRGHAPLASGLLRADQLGLEAFVIA